MSTPIDWETIRDLLRDVIAALREVATAMGRSAATDSEVAQALRDMRGSYREWTKAKLADTAEAVAAARAEGHAAGYRDAVAAMEQATAATRAADEETSVHRTVILAFAAPVTEMAQSAIGKKLIGGVFAAALILLTAACAWGTHWFGRGSNGQ